MPSSNKIKKKNTAEHMKKSHRNHTARYSLHWVVVSSQKRRLSVSILNKKKSDL